MTQLFDPNSTFKRISEKKFVLKYLYFDFIALILSHYAFGKHSYFVFNTILQPQFPLLEEKTLTIICSFVLICFWFFAFYLGGHYSNTTKKSGTNILGPTLTASFLVSLILFFILFRFSTIDIQEIYFSLFFKYFALNFIFILSFRMLLIWHYHYLIKIGKIGFSTILIGNNSKSIDILKDFYSSKYHFGNKFIGYIAEHQETNSEIDKYLPCLGRLDDLDKIIDEHNIDEAIVTLNQTHHHEIGNILNQLKQKKIVIKLSPDLNAMLEGTVKMDTVDSVPFIVITNSRIPVWQKVFKRCFDYSFAWIGLILTAPLFIFIAIGVKLSSHGPIFFQQKRLGKNKKPFYMYKFRSMYVDAEKDGPALSSINDPRITPFGRYLRKWHLDELPQFINIIMGDMSFVGPRPERKHFIDQVLPIAPHYAHIFTVKPGITSWGMVKFGYAENIQEMIERLQYDLIYLENRTIVVDFKIMLYTIRTILTGEGK